MRNNNNLTPSVYFLASFKRTMLFSKKGRAMLVNWKKDIDDALAEAKTQNRPLLIDFSAAPA